MCNTCNIPSCTGCRNWNQPAWNPPYTQPRVTPYNVPFNRNCVPPVPPPFYGPCPTCKPCLQTGCLTYITSDCVTMAKKYLCLGIGQGDLLTAAFDKVEDLCNTVANLPLPQPPLDCPTWSALDVIAPWSTTDLSVDAQAPEVSNTSLCVVRLRGLIQREFDTSESESDCTKRVFQVANLPTGTFPLKDRILPTVVSVTETNSVTTNTTHLFQAWLEITTAGLVVVVFYVDHCLLLRNEPYKVILTFDGLTYETN